MNQQQKRIIGLDVFRGWALVMMMIFHFSYYLGYFGLVDVDVVHGVFWIYFRYLIVTVFMLSVGISLSLVHTPHVKWRKGVRRAFILGISAVAVTAATYIQAPHAWVYFGILHLIWIASIIGLLFIGRPWIALAVALLIFIGSYDDGVLWQTQHHLFDYLKPMLHLPSQTEDLARFFPWFGAVAIGIAAHDLGWDNMFFGSRFLSAHNSLNNLLSLLGRHSLMVYLVHAPVLYGLIMAVWWLSK